jgi:hypothetical protein
VGDAALFGVVVKVNIEAVLQQINDAGEDDLAARIDGFPVLASARIAPHDAGEAVTFNQ